jgi:hypothetical protein
MVRRGEGSKAENIINTVEKMTTCPGVERLP